MSMRDQHVISQMFDGIADTYDSTNRILSLGLDVGWRSKIADFLPDSSEISLLDVATGTADVLITLCAQYPAIKHAIGVDLAENMLAIGQKKVAKLGFSERISLQKASADELPFSTHHFDVVTIAFGIRNVVAQDKALTEFFRVLKPHGRLIILEFSMPQRMVIKYCYQFYFRHVLPRIGGWLSNNTEAYRYLNRSVEAFCHPKDYQARLLSKGFTVVELLPLSCGVAHIYCARKG